MLDFEITVQDHYTGNVKSFIVQGEELAETLMDQKAKADEIPDGSWFVIGIRLVYAGFIVTTGSEVIKDGKRGVVTEKNQRTGMVGVMWIDGSYAVREDPADLMAIS